MNAATRLHAAGQSLWLDNITRRLLDHCGLARYIADASFNHGHVGDLLPEDARGDDEVIAHVEALRIEVAVLAGRLQRERADAFVKSWSDLMASIESRTRAVAEARR